MSPAQIGELQRIDFDGVPYEVTVSERQWQPERGTFRYRIHLDCEGLGWHARSFSDKYDMCGSKEGYFVTLFHTKKKEPLEKIARAFFGRRWNDIDPGTFQTLAVSRFLAAAIVARVAQEAFPDRPLIHYPTSRLMKSAAPMLACGNDLWIGHRFFSEDAYQWARHVSSHASRVVAVYLANTKYQIRTDLPANATVHSATELDASALGGRYEDLILVLLRRLELPTRAQDGAELEDIVFGRAEAPHMSITESDVHEALAVLNLRCSSKEDLRYQLAAGVLLNAWIESERALGFTQRKKFYAFKARVDALARWVAATKPDGVSLWAERLPSSDAPVVYMRVDGVDFSFHALPVALELLGNANANLHWSGVRLKPIAPLVLAWAKWLRERNAHGG